VSLTNLPSSKINFKILAPSQGEVPDAFSRIRGCRAEHERLLSDVQRLRGDAYRECGPTIAAQLSPDGRHQQAIDPGSWHLILEDGDGHVVGCSRYREIKHGFQQTGASHSAIASCQKYGQLLRLEVENEISFARRRNMQYGEAGGWALRPEIRCSTAAINSVLMTFALAQQLGGGLGITTATTRHHSSTILKRLGGRPLDGIPAYYDPAYECVMEIIHFDSATLGSQYAARMERFRAQVLQAEVICPDSHSSFDYLGLPMSQFPIEPSRNLAYMVQ
jgi:hypothetical protein